MATIRIVLSCAVFALAGLAGCSPRDSATTAAPGTTTAPANMSASAASR